MNDSYFPFALENGSGVGRTTQTRNKEAKTENYFLQLNAFCENLVRKWSCQGDQLRSSGLIRWDLGNIASDDTMHMVKQSNWFSSGANLKPLDKTKYNTTKQNKTLGPTFGPFCEKNFGEQSQVISLL